VAVLERLVNLVNPESRVSQVQTARLGCKDQLGLRDHRDRLDNPDHLDCRDSQVFRVLKDDRDLLVRDLHTALILHRTSD